MKADDKLKNFTRFELEDQRQLLSNLAEVGFINHQFFIWLESFKNSVKLIVYSVSLMRESLREVLLLI